MEVKVRYRKMINKLGYEYREDSWIPVYKDVPNYESKELSKAEMKQCFFDFVNISTPPVEETEQAILDFHNKWGTLTGAEDIPGFKGTAEEIKSFKIYYKGTAWFYNESKRIKDILFINSEGKKKMARDKFLEGKDFALTTTEWEEMDYRLRMVIRPNNLEELITYQFVEALDSLLTTKHCEVCNRVFQKKASAKMCSEKCRKNKAARKARAKQKKEKK